MSQLVKEPLIPISKNLIVKVSCSSGGGVMRAACSAKNTALLVRMPRVSSRDHVCWRARSCRFVTDETDDELLAKLNDEAEVTHDYVTPGGKVIPAIYVRLRNRINRCAGGLGSIVEGDGHVQNVLLLGHDAARGSLAAETRNPARASRLAAGSFLSRPYYFSVSFSSVTSRHIRSRICSRRHRKKTRAISMRRLAIVASAARALRTRLCSQ